MTQLTAFAYALAVTAVVAGCWFVGPALEKVVMAGPALVRRLAFMTLALAMVRGLMRMFI